MKITHVLVVTLLLAPAFPAAAQAGPAEHPSDERSGAALALVDDAPLADPPATARPAPRGTTADDGWERVEEEDEGLMSVPAAAAVAGTAAGITGVGGMALYVMTGGLAAMMAFGPHPSPIKSTALTMYFAAPFVFGALTLASAAIAGGLTWALSDGGVGAVVGAAVAAGLGVLVGVPVAALGVVVLALAAIDVGFAFPQPLTPHALNAGLFIATATPVFVVAATVAGLTAAAAFAGDATEDALISLAV